jgi:peptide/nickel transport system permease protein
VQTAQASRNALAGLAPEPGALIGGGIDCFLVILVLFAPIIAPYDPIASDWGAMRLPPDLAHPFGTDDLGILSRVIFGAGASLAAGFISVVIGVPLRLLAGYFGSVTDVVISRCADACSPAPSSCSPSRSPPSSGRASRRRGSAALRCSSSVIPIASFESGVLSST